MNTTKTPTTTPLVIEAEARPITEPGAPDTQDGLYLLTCLAVGGGIEAVELLISHARAWQTRFATTPRLLPMPREEKPSDLLRYALVGLIFDTEERVRENTAWWGNQLLSTVGKATEMAKPVTDSWLMAPFQKPMRSLTQQMQSDMARLIRRGRMEEAMSRVMALELTDEVVTVVLDYLGDKPEVRDLIMQQSTGLAEEVVGEVRDISVTADNFAESIARRLFRRGPRQPSTPPPSANK